jgi:hypothetical protein
MRKIIAALVLAISVSACAAGTTNLTLTPPTGKLGVLSEAASTRVDVPASTDARPKTDRIGDKRNGYGMVMGAVGSVEPPATLVERALEQTLTANKHIVGGADDRYVLQSTLKTFWFDYKTGLVTVEFFGNVQADVALVDRTTGQKLYSETFDGYFSEKTGGGLSKTWTRIMDGALADFTTKVGNSDGLKSALAATHAPAPGGS